MDELNAGLQSTQSFSLYEAGDELHVRWEPGADALAVNAMHIRQTVQEGGWGALRIDDKAIHDFTAGCRDADHMLDQVIGKRYDGEFSIVTDNDLMTAWLTLVPPQGGKAVRAEEIDAELRRQGIVFGLQRRQMADAMAAGFCERTVIACGDPPRQGTPTRFQPLYEQANEATKINENDRIRYADLCHLLLIKPGDPLMRRIPPIPGKNGTDIMGQAVFSEPVPDVPFGAGLNGAEPDRNDPDLLVAVSGGQPTVMEDGVNVNPAIAVPDVDLATGSIEFEGTLHVRGDIKAGMRVKVSGDVIVEGTMEAAEVIAGGNVAVRGGIVGHPDFRPGAHTLPETTARIICDGSVQALFMENAHIESGQTILIGRAARQCELIARDEIIVGKGKTGQIIGGRAQAMMRVAAGALGAPTGIKTQVQVGCNPYLEKQIAEADAEFSRTCGELENISKLLAYFRQNPAKGEGGVAARAIATHGQLKAMIDTLMAEIKVLQSQLELTEQATVEAGEQICYGVEVRISQQVWQPSDDMGRARLELRNGKIVVMK